ncbi:hypothetical protein CK503_10205 [Aliifodinibius salipaludis]|uniref:phosphoribosylglycinamide formyltransferase 1 n=1 Tax=Fodinibius salipaludis TaxID=2032627 RepID=A0A2A2GAY1_9BACT|nr:formyltransferase family protein [Aliifodinibius salipaludis]PAU94027.1 hypothetical protein CK503_10205 [Aliifodinibius salipaludis]
MNNNRLHKTFDVFLIGMTDRPQSINAVLGLLEKSNHNLSGVILEKRFARRATSIKFYMDLFGKFSFSFLKSRLVELVKIKLKQLNKEVSFEKKLHSRGIAYHEVDNINGQDVELVLEKKKPDVIVLAGAPIIKPNILKTAKSYVINVHRSLLPAYAGLDAIFWALYHGEDTIGATVHTVSEKIDAGKIILQKEKEVLFNDDLDSLTTWYNNIVPDMLVEALDLIADPEFVPREQDFSKRSYFSWPTKKQRKELQKRLSKKTNK